MDEMQIDSFRQQLLQLRSELMNLSDVVKDFVTPQLSRFLRLRQLLFIIVGAHVTQV